MAKAETPPSSAALDVKKEPVPKFVLVDSSNRVRELTGAGGSNTSARFAPLAFGSRPMAMPSRGHFHGGSVAGDEDFAMSQAELDEQAQLAQQLEVQREEMRFVSPLPRPQLHNSGSQYQQHQQQQQRPLLFNHAFTYSDPNSSQQQFTNPLKTPPTVPPISPFAGLAVSAPSKSTIVPGGKLPNPFAAGLSTTVDSSPRLPSLNMFRAGSPGQLKMGIAAPRPPPLSLRSSSSDSLSTGSLSSHPSPSSFSFQPFAGASPHRTPTYSQSLPSSVPFLHSHEMRKARMSFDGEESVNMSSDDEESGMLLLSSSVDRAGGLGGARTGRVCRYADCNNIARSRGLCRTHGGGKRCSHPNCNKSAQANRKCIAHGGGTPCSFGDCEKTAQSRGLCKAHGGGARCKHPDCPKSSQSKGLCRGHGGGIKCKEDGCEKWVQKNGYCIKHGRERSMTS
ncbi:hypothetical protein PybrP1_011068 [[Pythium] brassicae (nom. inval.)]|nr:hypothetical protein PybrP1_011068 [[Pythium] brassicae (nom. inval.)]